MAAECTLTRIINGELYRPEGTRLRIEANGHVYRIETYVKVHSSENDERIEDLFDRHRPLLPESGSKIEIKTVLLTHGKMKEIIAKIEKLTTTKFSDSVHELCVQEPSPKNINQLDLELRKHNIRTLWIELGVAIGICVSCDDSLADVSTDNMEMKFQEWCQNHYEHLKTIKELKLSNLFLTHLPAQISMLSELSSLDLSNNLLSALPSEFFELKNLTTLKLDGNQFSILTKDIGKLEKLCCLSLQKNQLEKIPKTIGLLQNMSELNLNENYIRLLPAEICAIPSLEKLYIADNCLQILPIEIGMLENLKELMIKSNLFNAIPQEIFKIDSKTTFHLDRYLWEQLPDEIKAGTANTFIVIDD